MSGDLDDSPSICVGCGLCCDGTLHSHTDVNEEDEASAAATGLIISGPSSKRIFRQPCLHFACGRCRVYDKRPPVCRTYRCALLKKVDRGEMSKSEAREKIDTAKGLVAAVRAVERNVVTPTQRREFAASLKESLAGADKERQREIAGVLLDLGALDSFLARWFLKKKSEPAGPEVNGAKCGGGELG